MKNLFLILLIFTFSKITNAQSFVKGIGGTSADEGYSIATDASGNVYTTGYFRTTVDFDPGAGTANLISAGGSDIFISKLDALGNYVWSKGVGGTTDDYGFGITVDPSGNIYVTGYFIGTADFDPGPGTTNLVSVGGSIDIFILKLDSDGNFLWAKSIGNNSSEVSNAITNDASGNIYITGNFRNTMDFDTGPGVVNLTSSGGQDGFIAKYDASCNLIWAKAFGGPGLDNPVSIAVDLSGNVYTNGHYSGTSDFDPDNSVALNFTSNGGPDVFVSKLNSSGNLVWAKSFGGTNTDIGQSISVDLLGNVYTTGYFYSTVDFNPDAGYAILSSSGGSDVFVSKLNSSGNLVWAKNFGATANEYGNSIKADGQGNLYITGYFNNTVDFDLSSGVTEVTSAGAQDVFVLKLNTAGNFILAKGFGGASDDYGKCVSFDNAGNIYATGTFQSVADFDPGAAVLNITSVGSYDLFILKLTSSGVLPLKLTSFSCSRDGSTNKLQWLASNENLVSHFLLDKSVNGYHFYPVANVNAKGTGNNFYNYDDLFSFHGITYYRLKIIDLDGKFSYSNIISIAASKDNSPSISIYPNPVVEKAFVQINNNELLGTVARLFDVNGKLIKNFTLNKNTDIIDLTGLQTGSYFLKTMDNKTQIVIKR